MPQIYIVLQLSEDMHRGTQLHYVMQNVVEGHMSVYGGIIQKGLTLYKHRCRSVSMQLTEAKRNYYSTKIEASTNDQKSVFDITKKKAGEPASSKSTNP